jgi:hypothetical protein
MAVDKTKIVLTFKHPRVTRALQELEGRRYFAGAEPHVIDVGDVPKFAIDVARSVEDGDVVWLRALNMIVVRKDRAGVGGPAQITLFCKTLAKYGATLIEGMTGRSSAVAKQEREMINEAHGLITKGGSRLPKTGGKSGRKKKEWPNASIEAAARKTWRSKNIASDNAAVREIKEQYADLLDPDNKPMVTDRLIRSLGPSGRQS